MNMRYKALVLIASVAALSGYELAFSQSEGTCSTVMDCAQKAMEAAFQAKKAIRVAVPKGSVIAFNLDSCPDGWQLFQPLVGRVAVGAGVDVTGVLTARKLGDKGGEELHTLTVEELPKQAVEVKGVASASRSDRYNAGGSDYPVITKSEGVFPTDGGGKAHNIMQPYYILTYCERT
ncbi:hypothetical protein [Mesorhizobium sp. WSM3868]|uniref:hypothetical protein n=1 Tax=Mesorhizobium sp. WSM3868 TaxID=2029405 RepID=UPI000BB0A7BF|nr:hypothetical protein [Mesorhizobium sp. WSM3868]PBB39597.1 hypothetical protein CK221_01895 [Mesorhizobium sp. WSM3868]